MASVKQYETIANDWLEEDNLMLLECWARDGYTYKDIANRIGITEKQLRSWRTKYPEIKQALKYGREIVDYKVENALLKSALGYKTQETKVVVELDRETGELVKTRRETTTKEFSPNVTAIQVWLYNRCQDKWKKNRDAIVELGEEDSSLQITVTRATNRPKIDESDIPPEVRDTMSQKGNQDLTEDTWEDEDQTEINRQVTITKSKKKVPSIKEEQTQDLDYWPDDWSED